MKGDFTRFTFNADKQYRNVLTQQGRVTVDADPNEQQFITSHRIETEAADVIGDCGAPFHAAGFGLAVSGSNLTLSQGRFYVDGILCENTVNNRSIAAQPDLPANGVVVFPDGASAPLNDAKVTPGVYIAFLDVWLRHITALQDDAIREKALGGPDTATRLKTTWQVKLLRVGDAGTPFNCLSNSPLFNTLQAGTSGKMRARAQAAAADDKPCVVPPGAGFQRLENQLYRVEVHQGGGLGGATFKWSRDNGSLVVSLKQVSANPGNANHADLTVSSIGRDKVLRFTGGQWVELTDDTHEETARPGILVQVVKAEGEIITVDRATAFDANSATFPAPINLADFPKNAVVRRWDFTDKPKDLKIVQPASPNDWLKLEDGLEVKFENGDYRSGDYWLIPARTVEPYLEWPKEAVNTPAALQPFGVEHHYCRLAVVSLTNTAPDPATRVTSRQWALLSDCRNIFPPVTELTSLFYVSGDGQEVMPNLTQPAATLFPLPQPLKVGIANGQWPVKDATVRFELLTPNSGDLNGLGNTFETLTGADGIATCNWSLRWAVPTSSPTNPVLLPSHQVKATLLKADGTPARHLPVIFTANLSLAERVAYDPAKCPDLAGITNVQDAIDKLCERKPGGGCSVTVGKDGQFATLNDAIKSLLAQQLNDICICLLPGVHALTENLIVQHNTLTLKLEGCGRGSHLQAQRFQIQFLGLNGVTLSGIDFSFTENDSPLVFSDCDQVTISDCDLIGSPRNASKGSLVTLVGNGRTWIENNVLANYDRARFELHQALVKPIAAGGLFQITNPRVIDKLVEAISAKLAALAAAERRRMADELKNNVGSVGRELNNDETTAYGGLISVLQGEQAVTKSLPPLLISLRKAVIGSSIARALTIIRPLTDVSLEDNTIIGLLSLYGLGGSLSLPERIGPIVDLFKRITQFSQAHATLSLRNNHLTRMVLGDDFLTEFFKKFTSQIPGALPTVFEVDDVFGWLALTDNSFNTGNNQWLGKHCSFSANRLLATQALSPNVIDSYGIVMAETGSYVANSSVQASTLSALQKRVSEKAANLNVNVVDR